MTENVIMYVIVGIIWLLAVFSFVIGLEKMVKIILGNYILSTICIAASQSIGLLVDFLNKTPDLKFAGFSYNSLATFFADGKTTIVLIIYVILLVVVYKNSSIKISVPTDQWTQKLLFIFLVPLTVISMILALQIVIMWVNVINVDQIQAIAWSFSNNVAIYKFIALTPVWLLLHGLATILITSEMKVGIKTGGGLVH